MVNLQQLLDRTSSCFNAFHPLSDRCGEVNLLLHNLLYGADFPMIGATPMDWRSILSHSIDDWGDFASRDLAVRLFKLIDWVHDHSCRMELVRSAADDGKPALLLFNPDLLTKHSYFSQAITIQDGFRLTRIRSRPFTWRTFIRSWCHTRLYHLVNILSRRIDTFGL